MENVVLVTLALVGGGAAYFNPQQVTVVTPVTNTSCRVHLVDPGTAWYEVQGSAEEVAAKLTGD